MFKYKLRILTFVFVLMPLFLSAQNEKEVFLKLVNLTVLESDNPQAKDFENAINAVDKLIKKDKKNVDNYFYKAIIYQIWGLTDTTKFTNAIKFYSIVLQKDHSYLNAYYNRGYCYFHLRDYKKFQMDYDAIALNFETGHSYYMKYAPMLFEIRDFNKVIQVINYDLDLTSLNNKEKSEAFSIRGICYLIKRDYEKTAKDFQDAYNLLPNASNTMNFALIKYYLGDYKESEELYIKALTQEGFDEMQDYIYNNLANLYHKLGNNDDACKYWQLAIDTGYVYNPFWKNDYDIEDPNVLINLYCK